MNWINPKEKITDNTVHSGCLYSARPIRIGEARPISAIRPETKQGRSSSPSSSVTCRQNPAGRRLVGGGGVAGEQAGRVADRFGSRREGGLTGAGGSTAAQTERQGATVVEQRSSRGRQQGGRGSSRRRCSVRSFGGGPGRRFMMAQRWQAQRHSGGNRRRWRKGLLHGERCSFYSSQRRLPNGSVSYSWGGRAVAVAVQMQLAWAAPLFGPCGWRAGPTRFCNFPNYPNWLKLGNWKWMPYLAPKIPNVCM
jgi:hypothetical protein